MYYEESEDYTSVKYAHDALMMEIVAAFNRGDKKRCKVLWHCYDVMFSPPVLRWDLQWRQSWGY